MSSGGRWADLRLRLLSGVLMALIGVAAIRLGGPWFLALAILAATGMVWELAAMLGAAPAPALLAGAGAGAAVALAALGGGWGWGLVLLPALLIAGFAARDRAVGFAYGIAVVTAAAGLAWFREVNGGTWLFWLLLVVIATDILGYFAGRSLGGPKFWPKVSPKKTWSGIVAGWLGAALVGALFLTFTNAGYSLPVISVIVSLASQMGDIAESAVKRRAGVKDSSNLIPGHGGLLDRFDGVLGAALMMLAVALVVEVPVVRI